MKMLNFGKKEDPNEAFAEEGVGEVLLPDAAKLAMIENGLVNNDKEEHKMEEKIMPQLVNTERGEKRPVQECLISNGTKLVGGIDTTDNVLLAGEMEGNLISTGTVRVTGSIKGDLSAMCVDLVGGSVQGNIVATDVVNLDKGGRVIGNLQAKAINLKAGTNVVGDIKGAQVFMESGAGLHGKLDIGD